MRFIHEFSVLQCGYIMVASVSLIFFYYLFIYVFIVYLFIYIKIMDVKRPLICMSDIELKFS